MREKQTKKLIGKAVNCVQRDLLSFAQEGETEVVCLGEVQIVADLLEKLTGVRIDLQSGFYYSYFIFEQLFMALAKKILGVTASHLPINFHMINAYVTNCCKSKIEMLQEKSNYSRCLSLESPFQNKLQRNYL